MNRDTIKVLMIGADDAPGGVANYINTIISQLKGRALMFDLAVPVPRADNPYFSAAFAKHVLPIDYGACALSKRVRQLKQLIVQERIDVVHAHTARAGLLAALVSQDIRRPFIYTGHGWRFEQKTAPPARYVFRELERYVCRRAAACTFLSNRERCVGINSKLVVPERAFVINTRIDHRPFVGEKAPQKRSLRAEWNIPENAFLIGNVGAVDERKDPFLFIRIASKVVALNPGAYFLWIGGGPLHDHAEAYAQKYRLTNRIVFTGYKRPSEMPRFLAALDAFLFTSRAEGVPLAVIEANLSGVPVASARYSGVDDAIIDGVTGWLFDRDDETRAVAALLEIAAGGQQIDSLRVRAHDRALEEHSRPEHMAAEFEILYRRVTAETLPHA